MVKNIDVRRGDIFTVRNAGRYAGGVTVSGYRPAVIVSNNTGNKYSDRVEVVYLTSQEKKPMPTHVKVMAYVASTAQCEQIDTVGKDMLGGYVRTCSDKEMRQIDAALLVSLGLTETEPRTAEKCSGGGGHGKRSKRAGRNAPGRRPAQGRAGHVQAHVRKADDADRRAMKGRFDHVGK